MVNHRDKLASESNGLTDGFQTLDKSGDDGAMEEQVTLGGSVTSALNSSSPDGWKLYVGIDKERE